MIEALRSVQREILHILVEMQASYATPVSSEAIGLRLNLNPSYVRRQVRELIRLGLAGVRRGNGGGYYLRRGAWSDAVVR